MRLFGKREKTADEWFDLARKAKKPRKKIDYFTKGFVLNAKYANAWGNKGATPLIALGKYEEAIRYFDEALEIYPKDTDIWNGKAIILGYLKRYEEAIRCSEKAIEIDSHNVNAWGNKGYVLECLGKHEEAIECNNKALEIDPKNVIVWGNKGYVLACLGKHEEAIECNNKALKIDPKNVLLWNNKGESLLNLGRYEEAIRCYDKALEINPNLEEAKNNKKIAEEKIKEEVSTVVKEHRFTIERAIYDPCKGDFVERALPRMKGWINRYDSGAYWFAVSIQNNTDKTIEEWGVELGFSSALKLSNNYQTTNR